MNIFPTVWPQSSSLVITPLGVQVVHTKLCMVGRLITIQEIKSKVWVQSSCFYWPCQTDTINPALKIYRDTRLQQVQPPWHNSPGTVQIISFKSSQYDSTTHLEFHLFDFINMTIREHEHCFASNPPDSFFSLNDEILTSDSDCCEAIVVFFFTVYIECPSCVHVCFWVVFNEIRVQSML